MRLCVNFYYKKKSELNGEGSEIESECSVQYMDNS